MIIGTDGSLRECKEQGYLMMQYDGRKKFDPDTDYKVFRYLPLDVRQDMGIKGLGTKRWTTVSANELWEDYQRHKKELDSFAGTNRKSIEEIYDFYPLLNLADEYDAYFGIVE